MLGFDKGVCAYKLWPSPRSKRFLGLVTNTQQPFPWKGSGQEAANILNGFKGG